jgi:hypothetical protein
MNEWNLALTKAKNRTGKIFMASTNQCISLHACEPAKKGMHFYPFPAIPVLGKKLF